MSLIENYGPELPMGVAEELDDGLQGTEFELEEDIMGVEGMSAEDMAFISSMSAEDGIEIDIPHFANLADYLGDEELTDVANTVIEGFEADRDSRADWDETLTRGLDLLGLCRAKRYSLSHPRCVCHEDLVRPRYRQVGKE